MAVFFIHLFHTHIRTFPNLFTVIRLLILINGLTRSCVQQLTWLVSNNSFLFLFIQTFIYPFSKSFINIFLQCFF